MQEKLSNISTIYMFLFYNFNVIKYSPAYDPRVILFQVSLQFPIYGKDRAYGQ